MTAQAMPAAQAVQAPDPKRLYVTGDEARYFERFITAHFLALYAFLAAVYFLHLPAPLLALGWLFPMRAYLAIHELMHAPVKRWNPIVLLLPGFGSFFTGNFRMQRFVHMDHHRFVNDPKRDPDYARAAQASFVASYLRNLFQTEEAALYYYRRAGLHAADVATTLLNFALTSSMFYVFGWNYLWFFLGFRFASTLAYTNFSYGLHKGPGRELSTYDGFAPPFWPSAVGRFVVWVMLGGEHFLVAMRCHRIHHQNASFSLFHLEEATRLFLREGSGSRHSQVDEDGGQQAAATTPENPRMPAVSGSTT